jgi:hypothetical protein
VEESSRISGASEHRRLKVYLKLGRKDVKLLKKSVLSVSSSTRHTLHNGEVRAVLSVTTYSPATAQ